MPLVKPTAVRMLAVWLGSFVYACGFHVLMMYLSDETELRGDDDVVGIGDVLEFLGATLIVPFFFSLVLFGIVGLVLVLGSKR